MQVVLYNDRKTVALYIYIIFYIVTTSVTSVINELRNFIFLSSYSHSLLWFLLWIDICALGWTDSCLLAANVTWYRSVHFHTAAIMWCIFYLCFAWFTTADTGMIFDGYALNSVICHPYVFYEHFHMFDGRVCMELHRQHLSCAWLIVA